MTDDVIRPHQSIDSTTSTLKATNPKKHRQISSTYSSSYADFSSDGENNRRIYKKCVIQPNYSRISDCSFVSSSSVNESKTNDANEVDMESSCKYSK